MPTSAELCQYQQDWEEPRGLDKLNVDYNIPRTREELDEAEAETDPLLKLEEMIDVLIVLHGGMYKLALELGMPYDSLDKMIEAKMITNSAKYSQSLFDTRSTAEGVQAARHYWALGILPEEIEGNDVY